MILECGYSRLEERDGIELAALATNPDAVGSGRQYGTQYGTEHHQRNWSDGQAGPCREALNISEL